MISVKEKTKDMKAEELVIGTKYIIDAGYRNGGEVELLAVYGKHFCRVKDVESPVDDSGWETMIYRLSSPTIEGGRVN